MSSIAMAGLARPKPGTQNTNWVSQVGDTDSSIWAITYCHSGYQYAGSWNGKQNQDANPGTLIRDTGVSKGILNAEPNTHRWATILKSD